MAEKMKLRINIGPRQFVVDCSQYTFERATELAEKVAEVRRANSLFAKHPMEEGETREKWAERVRPLLEEDIVRKDGESVDHHLNRMFEAKADTHQTAHGILNAVAEVFGLPPVTKDEFKKTNWLELRSFLYDVLTLGDVNADDFFPKKPIGV